MTSIEEVELRLRALPRSTVLRPEDEGAINEIQVWPGAKARPPARSRLIKVSAAAAAAVVAILVVNIAAAYYAPKYQRAVADTPGLGPISQRLLSAVGLKGSDVAVVGDSASSAGHTLKLVGAYADGLRTVLFVSIDGKGVTGDPKQYGRNPGEWGVSFDLATLTDQFGRSYVVQGVVGPTDLQYEPLAWPASDVGARLTLHITGVWAIWKVAEAGPGKSIDPETLTTHGDWTLHVTLISSPAHAIALPAPIHTSQVDYTFTRISASETEMVLHWTVAGPAVDQMAKDQGAAPSNADPFGDPLFDQYLRPHLYSEAGTELQMQDFGYTWPKTGPAQGEMTVFLNGPGRYRIQIGTVAQSRWVVVP